MTLMRKVLLLSSCLLGTLPALAADPSPAERHARPCQPRAPYRINSSQGPQLWGTRQGWRTLQGDDARRSVLVSVDLESPGKAGAESTSLQLTGGRLAARAGGSVVGAVLRGTSSDGEPVEVAVCAAEPSPGDPDQVWYHVEAWNPVAQEWESPCTGAEAGRSRRALAVEGVWDATGARRDAHGKFTFACEGGAIAKCAVWGYQPWASRDGRSLADLHQACTRLARADYCGDGRSHTRGGVQVDVYDSLGVLSRTTQPSAGWEPGRGSFEAEWSPGGASCLAHTRDGRDLAAIQAECPGRFVQGPVDLGDGDRCLLRRVDAAPEGARVRNRSYGDAGAVASK